MHILVTGGLGFVGSAVAAAALESGHEVTVLDDASAGKPSVVSRIGAIAGRAPRVVIGDVCADPVLEDALADRPDAIVHCAGLKSIEESLRNPLRYYDVNVGGTTRLLLAMRRHSVARLVFSSSATVYGRPTQLPVTEDAPTGIGLTNPYGRTKHVVELLLHDASAADPSLQVSILRYFNPIGAHPSGLLGEAPGAESTNIFPRIAEVARGTRDHLVVTGTDYPTPDGTGVRDYIHVSDLAEGHLAALEHTAPGCRVFNLGTGHGTSVRELIACYEHASGQPIPIVTGPRRDGDVASCYADAGKALRELGWSARRSLADACDDSWRWQRELLAEAANKTGNEAPSTHPAAPSTHPAAPSSHPAAPGKSREAPSTHPAAFGARPSAPAAPATTTDSPR